MVTTLEAMAADVKQGKTEQATGAGKKYLKEHGDDVEILQKLVELYTISGNPEKAANCLQRAETLFKCLQEEANKKIRQHLPRGSDVCRA